VAPPKSVEFARNTPFVDLSVSPRPGICHDSTRGVERTNNAVTPTHRLPADWRKGFNRIAAMKAMALFVLSAEVRNRCRCSARRSNLHWFGNIGDQAEVDVVIFKIGLTTREPAVDIVYAAIFVGG
jgi:hypothetical protein